MQRGALLALRFSFRHQQLAFEHASAKLVRHIRCVELKAKSERLIAKS